MTIQATVRLYQFLCETKSQIYLNMRVADIKLINGHMYLKTADSDQSSVTLSMTISKCYTEPEIQFTGLLL